MTNVTHVLDTSALLAHYFGEPGADVVEQLWATGSARRARQRMPTSMS
jgi:PIN domain nuclease of toxin-antitoxin system